MAKRKPRISNRGRKPKLYEAPELPEYNPEFSFSVDAMMVIMTLKAKIEEAVKDKSVEISECKKNIPKSTIIEIIKQLGLGKWIKNQ